LVERPIGELALHNGAVSVHIRPYEIKTVKAQFAKIAPAAAKAE
jgi:hypothetical protein